MWLCSYVALWHCSDVAMWLCGHVDINYYAIRTFQSVSYYPISLLVPYESHKQTMKDQRTRYKLLWRLAFRIIVAVTLHAPAQQ